jgi:hypothetical protein
LCCCLQPAAAAQRVCSWLAADAVDAAGCSCHTLVTVQVGIAAVAVDGLALEMLQQSPPASCSSLRKQYV